MDLLGTTAVSAVSFSKHVFGMITRPYQTCRHIIDHGKWGELLFIGLLCALYFSLASLVKTAAFSPVLLTRQFIVLISGAGVGFVLMLGLFAGAGFVFKKRFLWKQLTILWGYTLIPTTLWFLMTSFLYILLPPPRTESLYGIGFSFLYLTISAVLFFWKAELYYLTLRFGLRFDLIRICITTAIYLPIIGLYSIVMYRLGIMRVPFL